VTAADSIKAAFPGSIYIDAPAADRRRWAAGYLDAMWGDHEGFACYAHGKPYIDAKSGKYRHHEFNHHFLPWPTARGALVDALLARAAGGLDVWVAPMLRATKARTKGTGAGSQWAWADLDDDMTVTRRAAIHALGSNARVVSSGTGHHVYVRLDSWRPVEVVEATNRKLAALVEGDAKWDDTSLLRPPGTFNLKPLIRHGAAPALVQAVEL